MNRSIVVKGVVFALVALPLVGCKKKETGTAGAEVGSAGSAGSASAGSATGSGSAVADTGSAAGSGSAGSAGSAAGSAAAVLAAPWAADTAPVAATSKVTAKRNGKDEGTFDRAIYLKYVDDWGSSNYQLQLSNCEKFSCAHFTSTGGSIALDKKFYADCPGAKTLDVMRDGDADPEVGPIDVKVMVNGQYGGGDLFGEPMKGSSLTALTDKEVSGKLAVKDKDGSNEAKGEFVAKNCGTMVFPKKER